MTYFTLFVDKTQVEEGVALLADGVLNPSFETEQIEAVKPQVHKNASSMDPETNAYESIHYTSFRDHALGQPSYGIRDNVYSITADQIKQFHEKYYVGDNIVVAGAGAVNPAQFNEAVQKHFGNVRASVEGSVDNSEEPFFTPSLMFQRDDELPNTSAAAAFIVPGRNHPDFFALNYFKRIIGEFRVDKHTGAHLNSAKLQYNSFHTDLGDFSDIIVQKPFYFAYSDVGLFGNWMFGNEIWNRQLLLLSQNKLSEYAQYVHQYLSRSNQPKFSEPEILTGMSSWKETVQSKLPIELPTKPLTWVGLSTGLKLPPEFPTWIPTSFRTPHPSTSGIRKPQFSLGDLFTMLLAMPTIQEDTREPL